MSDVSFLELQYKLSKARILRKPSRAMSFRDRQSSCNSIRLEISVPEMREVFERFDQNKDGKISQEEYGEILRAFRDPHRSTRDVPQIFQAVDLDGDGFIDFKEFLEAHKRSGGVRKMDIQNAFRMFDLNGDGKISAEEVTEVLGRLGERQYSFEDCRRMVRAVDSDGDGFVNMDEFIDMMTRP